MAVIKTNLTKSDAWFSGYDKSLFKKIYFYESSSAFSSSTDSGLTTSSHSWSGGEGVTCYANNARSVIAIVCTDSTKVIECTEGMVFYGIKNLEEVHHIRVLKGNLQYLFHGCTSLTTVDFTGFDTSETTRIDRMFQNCSSITSLDLSGFDTSKVTNMYGMFENCSSLSSLDISGWDFSNVTTTGCMFHECNSLTTLDLSNVNGENIVNTGLMFRNCTSLETLNMTGFTTSSKLSEMPTMFEGCTKLSSLDLSGFNVTEVTSMLHLFFNCESLSELELGEFRTSDRLESADQMFYGCKSLTSLDLSNMYTANIRSFSGMFRDCQSLETMISNGFLNNAFNKSTFQMFYHCYKLKSLNLSEMNFTYIDDMESMFHDCKALANIDFYYNPYKPTIEAKMSSMFQNCESLSSESINSFFSSYDKVHAITSKNMFHLCRSLTSLDISKLSLLYPYNYEDVGSTPRVTDTSGMFAGCQGMTSLTLGPEFDTSIVTNMSNMFADCPLLINLTYTKKFVTNSEDTGVTNMRYMFWNCSSLSSETLNDLLSSFDTGRVEDMSFMFYNCLGLNTLNLGSFDVSNVKFFTSMFEGCTNLVDIVGISQFTTSSGLDFQRMFYNCQRLKYLDIRNFDTRSAKDGVVCPNSKSQISATLLDIFFHLYSIEFISLGVNFRFRGDGSTSSNMAQFPTPTDEYIYGADGNWYVTEIEYYAPSQIPDNKECKYFASKYVMVEYVDDVVTIRVSTLRAIGEAIREKTGITRLLDPKDEMPAAIRSINT